ncbi:long-chain fatty acid transporter fat1 [Mactra antiquata]
MDNTTAPYLCDANCTKLGNPYELRVKESASPGIIQVIKTCDDDIFYKQSLQIFVTTHPKDKIELTTSGLQLKETLDYETLKKFSIDINISTVDGAYSVSQKINITVVDEDDLGISFDSDSYNCSIDENTVDFKSDCTVKAHDLDTGINSSINYEIVSVSPSNNGIFNIGKTNGFISLSKTLDRETVAAYVLFIKGCQDETTCRFDKANYTTVMIHVDDVDDHPPKMVNTKLTVNLTENVPIGTIVCQVLAEDKFDQGKNAQFKYQYISPSKSELFSLNTSTGLITTNQEIDRESLTDTTITLKIKAVSTNNTTLTSVPCVVEVKIIDENDNSPMFLNIPTSININKTHDLTSCVYKVNATDKDEGLNGQVVFTMEQDSEVFGIDRDSGCVKLKSSLNETFSFLYTLAIKAEDKSVNFTRSSLAILQVHVQDVNIHSPRFINLDTSIDVSEAILPDTVILELKAEDKDPNDTITFDLLNHTDVFCIIQSSLRTRVFLDREKTKTYDLQLIASDSIHEDNRAIHVDITDVNDNDPIFEPPYEFNVNETTVELTGPSAVGTVKATDSDYGRNGTVIYKIDENSQWRLNFSILNETGDIQVHNLDREMMATDDDKVQLTIFALDNGTPKRSSITIVTIHVLGVNDNKPEYHDRNITLFVKEGEKFPQLYRSIAYDRDIGNGSVIQYKIIDDTTSLFSIDIATGLLALDKPLFINSSNNGTVSFKVVAANIDTSFSDEQDIIVHISIYVFYPQDVNDHHPSFTEPHYNKTIKECVPRNKSILRVNAVDGDFTAEFNTVHYWIKDQNDRFYIDQFLGDIYLIGDLDYDAPTNDKTISLKVYATDIAILNEKNSSSVLVQFTIQNCNDNPPLFTKGNYECTVNETATGEFNCQVRASDLDLDDLTYSIVSPKDNNLTINASTGDITVVVPFDYEKMDYHLIILNVSVTDGKFKGYTDVSIQVLNIDDSAPVFSNQSAHFSVLENITSPYYIGWINVTDVDSTLDIEFLNCSDQFKVDKAGNIYSKTSLDFETTETYTCSIKASDTVNSAYGSVHISVQGVNDNQPVFSEDVYEIFIYENEPKTIKINVIIYLFLQMELYGFITNREAHNVSINEFSGLLNIDNLDRDIMGIYDDTIEFIVFATDNGIPELTGSATVKIQVIGINDNKPTFPMYLKTVNLTVKENETCNSLYTSKAYDRDIGNGSVIQYKIIDDTTSLFSIDSATGLLALDKPLFINSSNNGTVSFKVVAANIDTSFSDEQDIIVHISDVNDHHPSFTEPHFNKTIKECVPRNKSLLRVNAVDEDFTAEFNTVHYWIKDQNDRFYIDQFLGDIYLIGDLDYDAPTNDKTISLKVYATDIAILNEKNSSSVLVQFTIQNCNDNPPLFTKGNYKCTVNENATGEFNCQVRASDLDLDDLTYSIVSPKDNNLAINPSTGDITVVVPFDYEKMDYHLIILNVSVTDGKFKGYTDVSIQVLNIDDSAPVFSNQSAHFSVLENITSPYYIGWINVTDVDSTLDIEFLNCSDQFKVDKAGNIYSKTPLDFETTETYTCSIKASDTVNSAYGSVHISVQGVNDNQPVFSEDVYEIFIYENEPKTIKINVIIYLFLQMELYGFITNREAHNVSINEFSGLLNINNLDRDIMGIYDDTIEFIVFATDNGIPELTGSATVKIHVIGINDNKPTFPMYLKTVNLTVKENETCNSLYTSKAYDRDIGNGSVIQYKIIDDTTSLFSIDNATGLLSLDKPLFINSSNNGTVSFKVVAANIDTSFSDEQDIIVHISIYVFYPQDVNDHHPSFTEPQYNKTIKECVPRNNSLLRVNAVDEDFTAEFNTVHYWIKDQNDRFYIDQFLGDIYLIGDLDYDAPTNDKTISLKVYATDIAILNEKNSSSVLVQFTIQNCNDNPPLFTKGNYECTVNETATGEFNCQVRASDLDLDDLTYSIVSPKDNNLTINASTGDITVVVPFDYEKMDYHLIILNVSVTDGKFKGYTDVSIQVLNIDDSAPVFSNQSAHFSVLENITSPYYIGWINVTDVDSTLDIEFLNCSDQFKVDKAGNIYSKTPLDFETTETYTCSIKASDTVNSAYGSVHISVQGVNDNQPVFSEDVYEIFIYENEPKTIKINATDHDDSQILSYKIINSTIWAHNVSINEFSGLLNINNLDRDIMGIYDDTIEFIVFATDNGIPELTGSATVKIHVIGINDNKPTFPMYLKTVNLTVKENETCNSLYTSKAYDRDIGNGSVIQYKIIDDTTSLFSIDNATGLLSLDKPLFINSSNNGTVSFKVVAANIDTSFSDEQDIIVHISDVNDHHPSFTEPQYNKTIKECVPRNNSLLRVNAVDEDFTAEFNTVHYWIKDQNDRFYIDQFLGDIYLIGDLDYDAPTNDKTISLKVYATDIAILNEKNSSSVLVQFTIQNCNDNPPLFTKGNYKCTVNENATGEFNCQVRASDLDLDDLTYSIVSQKDNNLAINASTGDITVVVPFDYEKMDYHLIILNVSVTDGKFKGYTDVSIQVLNIDDSAPVFSNQSAHFSVLENITSPYYIGWINVTDIDSTLDIEFLNCSDQFKVDKAGNIYSKTPLDFETTETYTCSIKASDTVNSVYGSVHISVQGVNDNQPVFSEDVYEIFIYENEPKTIKINVIIYLFLQMELYGFITNREAHNVSINEFSGLLNINNLDRDIMGIYDDTIEFIVFATDNGIPELTGSATVKIQVIGINDNKPTFPMYLKTVNLTVKENETCNSLYTSKDVNDHHPSFTEPHYNKTIKECVPRNKSILRVNAVDEDFTAEFNTVHYWIKDQNDRFYIDQFLGDIYLIGDLDYDAPTNDKTISLKVYATDIAILNEKNSSSVLVQFTIQNCNDNPPLFTKGNYECTVNENATGEFNCQVRASDLDLDDLTYSIVSPKDNNLTINASTGDITVVVPFDYEKMDYHLIILNVSVTDGKFKGYTDVSIQVLNIDDSAPVFSNQSAHFSVLENITSPYYIGWINVTDVDSTLDIEFLNCSDQFKVDKAGNIYSKTPLDFETTETYTCSIKASDTVNSAYGSVHISVQGVNDNQPVFSEDVYEIFIYENEPKTIKINVIIYLFLQMELYGFITNREAHNVSINESSGLLNINNLDRDIMGIYDDTIEFIVFATDNGIPELTGSATVKIQVIGINDNKPTFPMYLKTVNLTVKENETCNSLYTSKAYDRDIGNGSVIQYKIIDDKTSLFSIDNTTGLLALDKPLFINSSNNGTVSFKVVAANINTSFADEQNITIHISAANLHKPEFSKKKYESTIMECTSKNTEILRVSAIDSDTTRQYNTVYYWMDEKYFYVDTRNGSVYLIGDIDYESNWTEFDFTIYATDDIDVMNKSVNDHTNVTVLITDCNDNRPIFTRCLYYCKVNEDFVGEFGCQVHATDADSGTIVNYTVMHQHDYYEFFEINETSGEIGVSLKFDYENLTSSVVFLNISACDGKYTSYTEIAIEILDVNDEAPEFYNTSYQFHVDENITSPYYVGFVNVSDRDSGVRLSFATCEDMFYIENVGDIFSNSALDYENRSQYNCIIVATDSKHNINTSVTIYVIDVNDNPPVFQNKYNVSFNETTSVKTDIIQVHAVDGDGTTSNSEVTYSIFSGNSLNTFSINTTSGQIQLLESFKREEYELIVKATDNGQLPLESYAIVTVEVVPMNNNPPVFVYAPYYAMVYENVVNKSVLQLIFLPIIDSNMHFLFQVTVEDIDGKNSLTFKVNNSDFYIDNDKHLVAYQLDAEEYNQYDGMANLCITVSDGTYSVNTTAHVQIIDQNDNYPMFQRSKYRETINDTTAVSSVILAVTACDEDITNSNFTYVLKNGKGDFYIDSTTGVITLLRMLGRNGMQYDMTVEVLDSGNPPKQNETDVVVLIIDTNNTPVFNTSVLIQTVNENDNTFAVSLAAVDNDNGPAGNVTYSIVIRKDLDIFHFDTVTATLTLANNSIPLDYETQQKYEFSITAKDDGVVSKSDTKNVTIFVNDVNEAPIITWDGNHCAFVDLYTVQDVPVLTVFAHDPDLYNASFNRLKYSINETESGFLFKIRDNGTIFTKTSIQNPGNFSFVVTITDNGNLSTTKNYTVVVPPIKEVGIEVKISENINNIVNVTQLDNIVNNYEVSYDIEPSAHSGKFKISPDNLLGLSIAFDKETTNTTSLHIYGRSVYHNVSIANITVNVEIEDVNDCVPEFHTDSYIITIDDVADTNAAIGEVFAVDNDFAAEYRNIQYTLDGNDRGYFRIENSGSIFVNEMLSLKPDNFTLTVTASDGKFTKNVSLLISVLDTNDHSPDFNVSEYRFEIVESNCSTVYCDIGEVLATDSDLNENGNISYQLGFGNVSLFTIITKVDGKGLIQAVGNIDREMIEQHLLTVCAKDSGHEPRQSCVPIVIDVLDVNDNSPVFRDASEFVGEIFENSRFGTEIRVEPAIVATDMDKGHNGTTGLKYTLNVTDGPICISNTYPVKLTVCGNIDREEQDIYSFSIEVHDAYNRSVSAPLTIYVKDVNDVNPIFTRDLYTFNVTENANVSEVVGNVSVTDGDLNGTEYITYVIENASPVYINGLSGILYVGGKMDREKTNAYTLNVSAYDGHNFGFAIVNINVLDMNDNPPEFGVLENEVITLNVTEEVEFGMLLNLSAYDKDEYGSNSDIVYTIKGSSHFTISDEGQLNLTSYLDREIQDHYELEVIVSDKGVPPLSSSASVLINVLDINDNEPVFFLDEKTQMFYSESHIIEKIPENSVIKLINARDKDFGINGTITYSIEHSDTSKYFKIDNQSGVVSIAQSIAVNTLMNIESVKYGNAIGNETANINLTIIATDGGGLSSNMTLSVFIEPLNDDNAPVFDEMVFHFNISENKNSGTYVGTCVARILNDTFSDMQYSLISGYKQIKDNFYIDNTGNITTRIPLDRESISQYTFAVKVRDGRIPERTAFAAVEIEVTDVNDNSPVFHNNLVNLEIPENSVPRFINVSATDSDSGKNGIVFYSLPDNYGGFFEINDTSGILNVSGPFDFEDINNFNLQVVAHDSGSPSRRNSSIHINVSIIDENDNAPTFVDSVLSFDIPENSTTGKIFQVNATDEDSGLNSDIVYKLLNPEITPFVIDAFSGDVLLHGQLDFEQTSNYSLIIQASDLGEPPLFTNKTIDINVLDVYDDFPKFENATYDITLASTKAVAGTHLIQLDVGVSNVQFQITGQDSKYFNTNGSNLVIFKTLDPDRNLFIVTIYAQDILDQITSCTVVVHTMGHRVYFPKQEYTAAVVENSQIETILVDLNTTEEFGVGAVYTIVDVIPPSGIGSFHVDSSTGVVKCVAELDRENINQYIITISAKSVEYRSKRDVQEVFSTTRIIVNVTDVNDNPPRFIESQKHVFGVPDNVKANYIITMLKAFDPDENGAGNIRFNITGGPSNVFGVNRLTGNIITLVSMASVKIKVFYLRATVFDATNDKDQSHIDLFIHLVPTEMQPNLLLDKSLSNFISNRDEYIRNMSAILGVTIQSEKIEGHTNIGDDKRVHVDLSKTDFFFHGFNISTENLTLVSNEEMDRLLHRYTKELGDLFGDKLTILQYHGSLEPIYDPSQTTTTHILLICMAVFIFLGSGIALFIALYSLSRHETECENYAKKTEERKQSLEIALSTIRSRQSSKMSSVRASCAVNPAYQETELNQGKSSPCESLESQELNFGNGSDSNRRFGSQSVIDSGVGNTSVHSAANGHQELNTTVTENSDNIPVGIGLTTHGNGPVMTSSPRIAPKRDVLVTLHTSNESIVCQQLGSSSGSKIIFNIPGVSETDDDFDTSRTSVVPAVSGPEDLGQPLKNETEQDVYTKLATKDVGDGQDDVVKENVHTEAELNNGDDDNDAGNNDDDNNDEDVNNINVDFDNNDDGHDDNNEDDDDVVESTAF